MAWFKVDDQSAFHEKIISAGNAAFGAWVRMGAHCNAQLTDGFVSKTVARVIATQEELDALVACGMLDQADAGFLIHDYLKYQPSRAEVLARRESHRSRMKSARASSVRTHVRDHNAVTDRVSDSSVNESSKGSGSGSENSGSENLTRGLTATVVRDIWLRHVGNLGNHQLPEIAVACEDHAALIGMDPKNYADRAISAFVAWNNSIPDGRRPQKSPAKFLEHLARLHEVVKGERSAVPLDSSHGAGREQPRKRSRDVSEIMAERERRMAEGE